MLNIPTVILPTKDEISIGVDEDSSNQLRNDNKYVVSQASEAAFSTIASLNTSLSPIIVPLDGKY